MKKLVLMMMAVAFVVSLALSGSAFAGGGKKAGMVTAIDNAAGTVTIQFKDSKEPTTLKLEEKYLKTLTVGENARIYYEDEGCTVVTRAKALKGATIPVGC